MSVSLRPLLVALVLLSASAEAAAPDRAEYRRNLMEVIGAHYRVIGMRDACSGAFPERRAVFEKSYAGWRSRHAKLLSELDQRVTAMVRAASTDEKDYARNVGRTEGALLQRRTEVRDALLARPRDELTELCQQYPDALKGTEMDFEREYADELKVIRSGS